MKVGRVGVWASLRELGEDQGGTAARTAEQLGFDAFWLGRSPRISRLRPLLEQTRRIAICTSVTNIWDCDPGELADGYWALRDEFGDRILVGIGVGHSESRAAYRSPMRAIGEFLDGLDEAVRPLPRARRCLAALGPNMLSLAAGRSLGALPYLTAVEHTRGARQRLGPDPLLAPELACVVDEEPGRAMRTARDYAREYLRLENYRGSLGRQGFEPADLEDGGSERLLDALVPRGSAPDVARLAHAHLDAGADHVALQALTPDPGVPRSAWTELAAALELS